MDRQYRLMTGEIRPEEDIKVSVVVPFYNLESFAGQTINSLLCQTLDSCEFIFVNDASDDSTLDVLLRAAEIDDRIRVLDRIKNGGISAARNDGISVARGKYISFVDGDDIVSPWYLEAMFNAAAERDDVMVCSGLRSVKADDVQDVNWSNPLAGTYVEYDQSGAAEQILYKRIGTTAPAKLAPRHVYLKKPFPEGALREELRSIAGYVNQCNSFRVLSEPLYGYVMRSDSTVWASTPKLCEARDYLEAIELSRRELSEWVGIKSNSSRYYDALMKCRLHDYLNRVIEDDQAVSDMERMIRADVRDDLRYVLFDENARLGNRLRLLLYAISPRLLDLLYAIYKKQAKGV